MSVKKKVTTKKFAKKKSSTKRKSVSNSARKSEATKRIAKNELQKADIRFSTYQATPRIISEDEKRQLILAHVDAREPIDSRKQVNLWMGVGVCVCIVVGAWLLTVGGNIKRIWTKPLDANLQQALDDTRYFKETVVKENMDDVRELQNKIKDTSVRVQYAAQEEEIIKEISERITSSTIDDQR
ncbi:MAG: hypothetical protein ABII13_01430 [Patescibacteria group bacterium]|nr:hypothetical protein [Patescibacteria group bacterium]